MLCSSEDNMRAYHYTVVDDVIVLLCGLCAQRTRDKGYEIKSIPGARVE